MIKVSGSSKCHISADSLREARETFPELVFSWKNDELHFSGKMENHREKELCVYLQGLKEKHETPTFVFPEYFWCFAFQECFE